MLTGRRAFQGEDVSDTLTSIFRDEPEWAALPDETPGAVRQAMRVCLRKNVKERVRDIGAIRLAIDGAFETEAASPTEAASSGKPGRALRVLLTAGLVAATALVTWSVTRNPPAAAKISRTSIVLPPSHLRSDPEYREHRGLAERKAHRLRRKSSDLPALAGHAGGLAVDRYRRKTPRRPLLLARRAVGRLHLDARPRASERSPPRVAPLLASAPRPHDPDRGARWVG